MHDLIMHEYVPSIGNQLGSAMLSALDDGSYNPYDTNCDSCSKNKSNKES